MSECKSYHLLLFLRFPFNLLKCWFEIFLAERDSRLLCQQCSYHQQADGEERPEQEKGRRCKWFFFLFHLSTLFYILIPFWRWKRYIYAVVVMPCAGLYGSVTLWIVKMLIHKVQDGWTLYTSFWCSKNVNTALALIFLALSSLTSKKERFLPCKLDCFTSHNH